MPKFMNLPILLSSGGSTVIGPEAWSSVMDALTGQISVSTIVGVLASVLTAAIGMVFMWWGVRRLIRTIMAAFRKGKASV